MDTEPHPLPAELCSLLRAQRDEPTGKKYTLIELNSESGFTFEALRKLYSDD